MEPAGQSSSSVHNPLDLGGFHSRGPSASNVERPDSPVSVQGGFNSGAPQVGQGFMHSVPQGTTLLGIGPVPQDSRKFSFDTLAGKARKLPIEVTRENRLSASEAGEMLNRIMEFCGVRHADPEICMAFFSALAFCHTVNSASVLTPGRAKFGVVGVTEEFDYLHIRNFLGDDFRRFFRAYADDITDVNKRILYEYDPSSHHAMEKHGWLIEVATERGLSRFPYLAHDSADACTRLSHTERHYLMKSKSMVIGRTVNSADSARDTSRTQSANNYDSTNAVAL